MAPRDYEGEGEAEVELLELPDGAPGHLPINSLAEMLGWYRQNLCNCDIRDPRGFRVIFPEPEFVHLIKLVTKEGVEPKNRQLTIRHIETGRIQLNPARLSIRRACELSWAKLIVQDPWKIMPNWQVLGDAGSGPF